MSHASMPKNNHRLAILKDRALMLSSVRAFFAKRELIEVDTPLLTSYSSIDTHIDPITAEKRFLITSPEYAMKRLVSEGMTDIYQLSHVFRRGEQSSKHNPEFTMIEWYRSSMEYELFLKEVIDLIFLFVEKREIERLSFKKALQRANPSLLPQEAASWDRATQRDFLFATQVEPTLGKNGLTVIEDFPPECAALSQIKLINHEPVAERFEIYIDGLELANGYHELNKADEQQQRFETALAERALLGKPPLAIDPYFLEALSQPWPDLHGVAVGFDRLMMLRHKNPSIKAVLPFDWSSI